MNSADLIVMPFTGEIVLRDSDPDVLGRALAELRALEAQARQVKAQITDALNARQKGRVGVYNGVQITRNVKRVWDPRQTQAALSELVDRGILTEVAAEAYVPEVRTRRPDGRLLNSLLTDLLDSDLEAAQVLRRARTEVVSFDPELPVEGTAEAA